MDALREDHRPTAEPRVITREPVAVNLTSPLLVCGAVLSLFLTIPLDAQIRGTVLDAESEPLSDVTVEIWSSEARLGATSTGPSGAFRFDVREARDAAGLSLRRLGYQPVVARASSGDTLLIFRMAEQPIALPQLTVSTARRVCPNREDADARRLWLTVRSRYATTTRLPNVPQTLSPSRWSP
ncbi:hypothetical protein BH20GEM2_BH20GEM2_16540 [soil metagenome]